MFAECSSFNYNHTMATEMDFIPYTVSWNPSIDDPPEDYDQCMVEAMMNVVSDSGIPARIVSSYKNTVIFKSADCDSRITRGFAAFNLWMTALAFGATFVKFVLGKTLVTSNSLKTKRGSMELV